jgi:hypothetical protein
MASSPETFGPDHTCSTERSPHDCDDSYGVETKPPFASVLSERLPLVSVFVEGGELLVFL